MITVERLKEFGANVDEGLSRCLNDENFYLTLVGSVLADNQIPQLETAVARGDLDNAFEVAHALKGVYANLSLTPLYDVIVEITELLRARQAIDYTPLIEKLNTQYNALSSLAD